ncbi:TrmH family RNA methyltransferase [Pseudodesulfovibrio sp.]|uniref:TrmH family RNA methyltransferase n=1 Tax=unclassified Pseudodesulfovibrio TaxID=2661612 RepID=UPI003B00C473
MSQWITDRRRERIEQVLARRQKGLTLVFDNIWDPHNVSAVLRSCDAFGVADVHLYYTESQWPELGRKSSGSAKKWIRRTQHVDAEAMVGELKGAGFHLVRTGFSDTAKPLMDVDFTGNTAIILSNEHRGTAPELAALVPDEVYIPMQGMVQSLNVSVAAAVILYEAFKQRHEAGLYDSPNLDAEELEAMRRDWCSR